MWPNPRETVNIRRFLNSLKNFNIFYQKNDADLSMFCKTLSDLV